MIQLVIENPQKYLMLLFFSRFLGHNKIEIIAEEALNGLIQLQYL